MTRMSTFEGFDPAALALLERLPAMSPDEFAVFKPTLKRGVIDPGAALIGEVADRLDADLTVVPRSSVSPLHRDLRFAAAGTPRYKNHLLLTTWQGDDKKSSPTFWIRVDAQQVGFASGIGFTPAIRERWRAAVGGIEGEELDDTLERLRVECGAEVAGDELKRVPSPFDDDHPRADLLRRTGFQVRLIESLPEPPAAPECAEWCTERLGQLLPVHRWLVTNLTAGG